MQTLLSLAEEYSQKKIYIWNVNRASNAVFTRLAFHEVDISGFVVQDSSFAGMSYVNRPILDISEVEEGAVIVYANDNPIGELHGMAGLHEFVTYEKILGFNRRLKGKQIVIYGIGDGGDRSYDLLMQEGCEVIAFCVTEKKEDICYKELPVIQPHEIPHSEDVAVVVAVLWDGFKYEIIQVLQDNGIYNIVVTELMDRYTIEQEVLFPAINKAMEEKKRIYLYGKRDSVGKLIENIFITYSIKIDKYIYKDPSLSGVEDRNELYYEDIENVFVLINEIDECETQSVCEFLDGLGFQLGAFGYAGIRRTVQEFKNMYKTKYDLLVGSSFYDTEYPGFYIYGNPHSEGAFRIVVLGGSTSADRVQRPECWPKKLYKKLLGVYPNVVLFNGAHGSQNVTQELLRLLRDVYFLKPDFVISMSGVNDTMEVSFAQNRLNVDYHAQWLEALKLQEEWLSGIKDSDDAYVFWFRVEKIMKLVAESYGAKFYGFLQPMKMIKQNKSLFETLVFESEYRKQSKVFLEGATDNEVYENLIHLFEDDEGMYIDVCHYTDKGNDVLADIVMMKILADYRRKDRG